MVAVQQVFLGVPCTTREAYRALRQLVRLLGRVKLRQLVASYEANPPVGVEETVVWVQGAHGNAEVRSNMAAWLKAKQPRSPA